MSGKIGIVTPYKDQRRALRREISHRFGPDALQAIEICTVVYLRGTMMVLTVSTIGWIPRSRARSDHIFLRADWGNPWHWILERYEAIECGLDSSEMLIVCARKGQHAHQESDLEGHDRRCQGAKLLRSGNCPYEFHVSRGLIAWSYALG